MRAREFLKSESGAVTVDWVVLTAATVGLGLAAAAAVRTGTHDLGGDISSSLSNARVAGLFGTNGLGIRLNLSNFLGSSPVRASTNRGVGVDSEFIVENITGPNGETETALIWRDSTNGVTWFDLPQQFSGDMTHLMGATVSYDVWVMEHRAGQNPNMSSPVFAIAGANGVTLTGRATTPPNTTDWTTMGVALDPGNWRIEGTNRIPTEAEMRAVLQNVQTVQSRAEFYGHFDQVAIRNMGIN